MIHGLRLSFQRSLTPRLTTSPPHSVLTSKAASSRILPFIPNWLEKGYVRDPGTSTSLFFKDVYGSQKRRGSQTGNRSLRTQQVTGSPKVQDGDSRIHLQGSLNPLLGDHNGLGGRLFESPRRSCLTKVSGLHSLRSLSQKIQNLPVPGYAFRPVLSPLGVHKNNQASKEHSSLSGFNCTLISTISSM